MDKSIEIINKQEVLGKNFTVYGTFENPLFLSKDVAEWIEHSDVSTMMRNVDDEEKVTNIVCTLGGNQESWFLTEEGLYEVLMQSRKPVAKSFKKEVKRILKELRTNGITATPATIDNIIADPDFGIKLLSSLKEERQKRIDVEKKAYQQEEIIDHKNEEIKNLLPDAQYARETLKSASTLTTTQVAKELGMSAVTLNKKLHEFGIQYKVGEQWVLYAKYEDRGYTKTDTYTETRNGESRTYHSTVWTESGRKFIIELIRKLKVA